MNYVFQLCNSDYNEECIDFVIVYEIYIKMVVVIVIVLVNKQ